MASYTEKEKTKEINGICEIISEGKSLRTALKGTTISSDTFYKWLDSDDSKAKQYARACDFRAENEFEDILEIADNVGSDMTTLPDGTEVVDNAVVSRDRLRVDARKWRLSKMNPKKYSDKIQVDNRQFSEQPLFPDVPTNDSNK